MKKIKFRKINNAIHRDLGYFFAGLTIIYAISGIAVNHISDWNPSYIISRKTLDFNYDDLSDKNIKNLLKDLSLDEKKYKKLKTDTNTYQIFLNDKTVSINLKTKKILFEEVRKRPFLYSFNELHLNRLKGYWTYFADFYAVSLIVITLSGFFVLKGKKGLKWRGMIIGIIGLIIPLLFLFF